LKSEKCFICFIVLEPITEKKKRGGKTQVPRELNYKLRKHQRKEGYVVINLREGELEKKLTKEETQSRNLQEFKHNKFIITHKNFIISHRRIHHHPQ
jgi:hypothetical protein